ncbi:uncharacterized protein L203_102407 [Cryptococcus depauperatus CBS 7841]|uniref:Outer spore wall protein RRT8 n=1 Tax=Cryptococcus depauperatus CBS 7841 TaxID=1295531 RepID=A0AAJ8JRL4_9TREE
MSSPQTRKRTQKLDASKEKVTEIAKHQVQEVGCTIQEGIGSGAWFYPLLGASYLTSHPSLIKPLVPALGKGILLSVATVAALFMFTYLPQVAVLSIVSGPLAFILAIPLVLSEAFVILLFLTRGFLMGQLSIDLFDAVMVQKGHQVLVEHGRQISSTGGKARQLGSLVAKPLSGFSVDNLVRYVLTLPLNFVPVVGTAFFLGYNGLKAGPSFHNRYFQLKGFDMDQRQDFIRKRRGSYLAFGTMATALNLIPVVSIMMTFTTVTGAALWAADLESKSKADPWKQLKNGSGERQQDEIETELPTAVPSDHEPKKEL